jgi:hypothetical protein
LDNDGDEDSPKSGYYDDDDGEVLRYGRPAPVGQTRKIETLVGRYFEAAAAADGAAGCRLLYAPVAESIVETDGRTPGLRGVTCAAVLSKWFQQNRSRLIPGFQRLEVRNVRIENERGYVLLGSGARTESYLLVHRRSGDWKVLWLVQEGLP